MEVFIVKTEVSIMMARVDYLTFYLHHSVRGTYINGFIHINHHAVSNRVVTKSQE